MEGSQDKPSRSNKFHFTDAQNSILRMYYHEKGVSSVGKQNATIIAQIAVEIGAEERQVRHWINAEKTRSRKQSGESSSSKPASPIKVKRPYKRTGFQLFCSEEAKNISGDGPTVMSELSKLWSNLTTEEHQSWKSRASEGTHWIDQPKKNVVRDLTTSIEDNLKNLSKLGHEGYTLILNKASGERKVMCSSDTVQNFVSCEEEKGQGLDENFFNFMCASSYTASDRKRKRAKSYDNMLEEVRADWKTKYRCVCGEGRIPYSHPQKLKAIATGLPEGVTFKQPSLYKQPELRRVHQNLDKFNFFLPPSMDNTPSLNIGSEQEL